MTGLLGWTFSFSSAVRRVTSSSRVKTRWLSLYVGHACGSFVRSHPTYHDIALVVADDNVGPRLFRCDQQSLTWIVEDITLDEGPDTAKLQKYFTYTAQLILSDSGGQPASLTAVQVWADEVAVDQRVSINGAFFDLPTSSTSAITVMTDTAGRLSVDMPMYSVLTPALTFSCTLASTTVTPSDEVTVPLKAAVQLPPEQLVQAKDQAGNPVFQQQFWKGGDQWQTFQETAATLQACATYKPPTNAPVTSLYADDAHGVLVKQLLRQHSRGRGGQSSAFPSRWRSGHGTLRHLTQIPASVAATAVPQTSSAPEPSFTLVWEEFVDLMELADSDAVQLKASVVNTNTATATPKWLKVAIAFLIEGAQHIVELLIDSYHKVVLAMEVVLKAVDIGLQVLCPWYGLYRNWDQIGFCAAQIERAPGEMASQIATLVGTVKQEMDGLLQSARNGLTVQLNQLKAQFGEETLWTWLTGAQATPVGTTTAGQQAASAQQAPNPLADWMSDASLNEARAAVQCQCSTNVGIRPKGRLQATPALQLVSPPSDNARLGSVLHPHGGPLLACRLCGKPRGRLRRHQLVPQRYRRAASANVPPPSLPNLTGSSADPADWWTKPWNAISKIVDQATDSQDVQQWNAQLVKDFKGVSNSDWLTSVKMKVLVDVIGVAGSALLTLLQAALDILMDALTNAVLYLVNTLGNDLSIMYVPVLSEFVEWLLGSAALPGPNKLISYLVATPITLIYKAVSGGQDFCPNEAIAKQRFDKLYSDFLSQREIGSSTRAASTIAMTPADVSEPLWRGVAALGCSALAGGIDWVLKVSRAAGKWSRVLLYFKHAVDFTGDFFAMPWDTDPPWLRRKIALDGPWESCNGVVWLIGMLQTGIQCVIDGSYDVYFKFNGVSLKTIEKFQAGLAAVVSVFELRMRPQAFDGVARRSLRAEHGLRMDAAIELSKHRSQHQRRQR